MTHDVIEDPDDTDETGNPYYTYVVSDIFIPRPDTTARSPVSTGQIYRVGDSARCRKFGVCTLEIVDLGHGIKQETAGTVW
jgi:hypothetical protein